jgi:hypothetical protein
MGGIELLVCIHYVFLYRKAWRIQFDLKNITIILSSISCMGVQVVVRECK